MSKRTSTKSSTKSKKTRAAVNRANAQKSTGPKTEQGKASSSQNGIPLLLASG